MGTTTGTDKSPSSTEKSLAILEVVAARGGASAGELADALGYSLPTVYRLAQLLVDADYLVHLRGLRRFELGYKVHALGSALHRQLGVSPRMRAILQDLHVEARVAAYYAVYRGTDVVLAHVVDSSRNPRIQPLEFGFHEATHATAFGKIVLSAMSAEQRDAFLDARGLPVLTASTLTSRDDLERQLESVRLRGVAWEREEFVAGHTCAAVPVRGRGGETVGAVALSLPSARLRDRAPELERQLREAGGRASRLIREAEASPNLGR